METLLLFIQIPKIIALQTALGIDVGYNVIFDGT
jgi:hypothetical protein